MADQTVRLVFLGDSAQAIRATDTVTGGVHKLSAAQKEQAAASRASTAEAGRASQGFRTLEQDIAKTSRGALAGSGIFRGLGRSIAFASASFLGGYGLLSVVTSSISVMKEAGVNAAETAARIKATGDASHVTARQIDVLATATARKTAYDVEQIHAAENVLLTFTEVRNEVGKGNDVYTRAVGLTADLARAMNQDVSSAALQLGRALNDPVRGLTTLTRAGVQFTAQQRNQVKALADSGEILKAQTIILDTVQHKVGGVAAAYGDTAAGKIANFRGEIRLLEKDFATLLLPDLVKVVDAATKWVKKLEENKGEQARFRSDLEGIAGAVGDVVHILKIAVDAVGGTKNALELLIAVKFATVISEWAGGIKLLLARLALIGPTAATSFATADAAMASTGVVAWETAAGGALVAVKGIGPAATASAAEATTAFAALGGLFAKIAGLAATIFAAGNKGESQKGRPPGSVAYKGGWVDPTTGDYVFMFNGQVHDTGVQAKGFTFNGAPVKNPGGTAADLAKGAGIQIPTSFKPTHQTGGLAGFPAVDIMARPGTPIKAPEDGMITRVDGHEPSEAPPQGQGGPWGLSLYFVGSQTGNTYYMTHLMKVGAVGSYRKGDRIGIIGNYPGSSADHVHVGIHQGDSPEAHYGSGLLNPSDFNLGGSGGGSTRRGGRGGATQLQTLTLALASAGTTKTTADDRAALQALIAYYKKQLANPNLPITTRIADLNTEAGFISQLDALAKTKKQTGLAGAAALINIHHTLDAVTKLIDGAHLEKQFDPALQKINEELSQKFITTATLARIRNQLSDITKTATAEINKAKAAVAANKQAFAATWASLATAAFNAFDAETASHISPARSLLNQLTEAHDQAALQQALTDAEKQLADARNGVGTSNDSATLDQIRNLVGQAALANAIDAAQSSVLGINPQQISSAGLIQQLQQLLVQQNVPDAAAVAAAQKAVDDAQYNIRVADLSKQADLEDQAYANARSQLRTALELNLAQWDAYYQSIGEKASKAAGDFAAVWAAVLAGIPVQYGGTNTAGGNTTTPDVKTIAPGFNIPADVIGGGFGGGYGTPFTPSGSPPASSSPTVTLAPGFNIPASVIGGGFGGSFDAGGVVPGLLGQPKLILAHGGERVLTKAQQQDGGIAHVHLSLGEGLDQLVTAQVVKAAPGISVSIGREADRKRREGRR